MYVGYDEGQEALRRELRDAGPGVGFDGEVVGVIGAGAFIGSNSSLVPNRKRVVLMRTESCRSKRAVARPLRRGRRPIAESITQPHHFTVEALPQGIIRQQTLSEHQCAAPPRVKVQIADEHRQRRQRHQRAHTGAGRGDVRGARSATR